MAFTASEIPTFDARLTPREVDALRLVAQGLTNKQIAAELNVALDTVGYYLKQIYNKLGVQNRAQAVSVGISLGFLPNQDAHAHLSTSINVISNPYKGLKPFQAIDSDVFFGREILIDDLAKQLIDPAVRFTAIVGPSGIGKSSLVNAGLIPTLRKAYQATSRNWFFIQLTPGPEVTAQISSFLRNTSSTGDKLIIIDQFEGAFTLLNNRTQEELINMLLEATSQPEPIVRVVVVLRADMLAHPLQDSRLGPLFQKSAQLVSPLSVSELERVIAEPARHAGLTLESGLVGTIIGDVMRQSHALPLLQFALTQMVDTCTDRYLTIKAYNALGGVTGTLTSIVEDAYQHLDQSARAFAELLFLSLIALDENGDYTRKRTRLNDFFSLAFSPETMKTVIETFADLRVLSLDWDSAQSMPIIDLAHESLVKSWPRYEKWIDDNRESLIVWRRLTTAAAEWLNAGRDPSFLLSGTRLDQTVAVAPRIQQQLSPEIVDYLDTSQQTALQKREQEAQRVQRELALQQQATRRARYLAGGLAVFLVVTALLMLLAVTQRNEAQANAAIADANFRQAESLRLAASASSLLPSTGNNNAEVAALLAIQSLKGGYSFEADSALLQAANALYTKQIIRLRSGFGDTVSPDGKLRAIGEGYNVEIWELAEDRLLRTFPTGASSVVVGVGFSPDSKYILVSTADRIIRRIDVVTGNVLDKFEGGLATGLTLTMTPDLKQIIYCRFGNDGGGIYAYRIGDKSVRRVADVSSCPSPVAISPDSQFIVYPSSTDSARVTRLSDGRDEATLATGIILYAAAISPDEKSVALGGADSIIHIWDIASGKETQRIIGHTNTIQGVAYSADGKLIASASLDSTVRIWDAESGRELKRFTGHKSEVDIVRFLPDQRLLSWSMPENVMRIWDTALDAGPRRLPIFAGGLSAVAVSPDSKLVGFIGLNVIQYAVVDIATRKTLVSDVIGDGTDGRYAINFSPDGQHFVVTGIDRTYLKELPSGQTLREFSEAPIDEKASHYLVRNRATFSPDGKFLLTTGFNPNIAHLWEVSTGKLVRTLDGHKAMLTDGAFSPDGKYVLTTGTDNIAIVWETETGHIKWTLADYPDRVNGGRFSHDGRWVVAASGDGTARIWDMQTGKLLRIIQNDAGWSIYQVVITPDDHQIITGDYNADVKVWDAATGALVRRFPAQGDLVYALAVSPNGHYIYSGGSDDSMGIWEMDIAATIQDTCRRVYADFSHAERVKYRLPETMPPVCPGVQQPLTLIPMVRDTYQTVRPAEWTYDTPGVKQAEDPESFTGTAALFIFDKNRTEQSPAEIVKQRFALTLPSSGEERTANGQTWTIYPPFEAFASRYTIASTQTGGKPFVVAIQMSSALFSPAQANTLYRDVLLKVVDNYKAN